MDYISVTNWDKYQHYRDRKPVWIKLYISLLDDYEYQQLSDHDKLTFLEVLIVSARTSNRFPNDQKYLKRTLSVRGKIDFTNLISKGFLECYQDASNPLASCYQDDTHSSLLFSIKRVNKYWEKIGLISEYRNFMKMRNQIKKPLNEVADNRLVARHKKLVEEGHDPAELINQSTASCWQGFHPIKDYPHEVSKPNSNRTGQPTTRTPADISREKGRKYIEGLADGNGNSVADHDGQLHTPVA